MSKKSKKKVDRRMFKIRLDKCKHLWYNKDRKKERENKKMTTTKIIPAETLAKELGVERRNEKIIRLKNRFIKQIIEELKELKYSDFIIGNDTFSPLRAEDRAYLNFTREELIEIVKELAKEFREAGYEVKEYKYADTNRKCYYSINVEF